MENIQPLIISLIADIVISIIWPVFYSSIMKPRIKRWQYILLMVLIFMLLTPLQYIFSIPHIVTFILGIIVNIGGVVVFLKGKIVKKIIYGLIPYISDMVLSSLYLVIRLLLTPEWQPTFGEQLWSEILEPTIMVLQIILSLFIISKIIQRKKPKINDFTAIYIISVMIVPMYMTTFIMYIYWTNVRFSVFCIVLVAYILLMSGLTITVLYYNSRMNKKQMKQNMIEYQYQFMNTQYEQLRNSYITYKKLRHDIKDHLAVVNGLAMKGEIEELQTYTSTLTQNWETLSSKTFCDVPAVDIIVAEKYNVASSSGIRADFVINSIKDVNVDNVYLSSIFANLLNNALEASFRCSHNPYISLRCGVMAESLVITCRNSMPDYQYPKSDAQNHGYGLRIIDDFVKLLGGTFTYEHSDSTFTAIVTIPVREGRSA